MKWVRIRMVSSEMLYICVYMCLYVHITYSDITKPHMYILGDAIFEGWNHPNVFLQNVVQNELIWYLINEDALREPYKHQAPASQCMQSLLESSFVFLLLNGVNYHILKVSLLDSNGFVVDAMIMWSLFFILLFHTAFFALIANDHVIIASTTNLLLSNKDTLSMW